jgi:hypothetical protein
MQQDNQFFFVRKRHPRPPSILCAQETSRTTMSFVCAVSFRRKDTTIQSSQFQAQIVSKETGSSFNAGDPTVSSNQQLSCIDSFKIAQGLTISMNPRSIRASNYQVTSRVLLSGIFQSTTSTNLRSEEEPKTRDIHLSMTRDTHFRHLWLSHLAI